jgi:hypothetical protein
VWNNSFNFSLRYPLRWISSRPGLELTMKDLLTGIKRLYSGTLLF